MNRATTSLPVPDSPWRQVVASVAATRAARLSTCCHATDVPNTCSDMRPSSIDETLQRSTGEYRWSVKSVVACTAFIGPPHDKSEPPHANAIYTTKVSISRSQRPFRMRPGEHYLRRMELRRGCCV